jgi:hypothetical protein
MIPQPASPRFHDSQNTLLYDDSLGKYVAYMRIAGKSNGPRDGSMWFNTRKIFYDRGPRQTHFDPEGKTLMCDGGRAVARIEIDDPAKTPWPHDLLDCVMQSDAQDSPNTDVQMAPVIKYPYAQDVYLALWTCYRHFGYSPNEKNLRWEGNTRANDGVQDVQLAVSRDGIHWTRPARSPYVGLGLAGGPQGGLVWPTLGFLRHNDEIYQYYAGEEGTHGGDMTSYGLAGRGAGALYCMAQRLDGFASADAGHQGGWFTTPLLVFSGTRLEFNLNASALGYLCVEIQDEHGNPIPGYTLQESLPIDRNRLAAPARWSSDKSVGDLQGRPVRMHVTMRSCKLYAFAFTEDGT